MNEVDSRSRNVFLHLGNTKNISNQDYLVVPYQNDVDEVKGIENDRDNDCMSDHLYGVI